MKIDDILGLGPVIPVLSVDHVKHAWPIAEALVAGGLCALEVTLRTPVALEVIAEMNKVPGAVVGAGTVTSTAQLDQAVKAGAQFIVAPGLTEKVTQAALAAHIPYLPGIATAGDVMRGRELGLTHFKFFPAEAAGGIPALKALCAPFFQCAFCPTGGITRESAAQWLALSAVACVGGSWLVPPGEPDYTAIYERAAAASLLRGK